MLDLSGCGDWQGVVDAWAASPAGSKLQAFVAQRQAAGAVIYPPEPLRALRLTPLAQTRVVILGQDPYHGPGQAEGLSLSVPEGVPFPPSLRNIFKEIQRDLGKPFPPTGSLVRWAEGGTLLLNAVLTVEDGQPASHAGQGWELLTDALMRAAAEDPAPKVFMLWGSYAQAKAPLIEAARQDHLVLKANHPSPLSALKPPRPFIGCGHFSTAKAWLEERGRGAPKRA
jgi:uracil-DNA glycosylase